jgi:hypothetical protein
MLQRVVWNRLDWEKLLSAGSAFTGRDDGALCQNGQA